MRTKLRIAASILTAMLLLLTFVGQSQARSLVQKHMQRPLALPSPLYNNVNLDDDTTTPKKIPSWWTGTNGYACDAANYYANTSPHTNSFQLGTTTNYRGVKACGPMPRNYTPALDAPVNFYSGAPTENEWECTELVKRYLYQAFGAPDLSAWGYNVVSTYSNSTNNDLFQSYSNNGTANQMPVAGDVLSFGTSSPGHTAIVTGVSVDANGNGTINIMEQNSSSNGTNSLYVGDPVVGGVEQDHGNAAWHIDTESGVGAVTGWLDPKTTVPSYNSGSSNNVINAVSAFSANNVWAVGSYGNEAHSLIEHWDGAHWTQLTPTSEGSVSNVLRGVKALSATDVWAVGNKSSGGAGYSLILHGTYASNTWTWTEDTTDEAQYAELRAIDGVGTDAWAVGNYWNGSSHDLTLHLSSGSWSQQSNVSPDTSIDLYGVSEHSSSDVWAVGVSTSGVFTMHYNGSWTQETSYSTNFGIPSGYGVLYGVTAISSTNAWAVGQDYGSNGFVSHWDGTHWSAETSLSVGTSSTLTAVIALDSNNIWAAGSYYSGGWKTLIWHSANGGSTWQQVTTENPGSSPVFNGIAIDTATGNTWAVGDYQVSGVQKTLTEFFN